MHVLFPIREPRKQTQVLGDGGSFLPWVCVFHPEPYDRIKKFFNSVLNFAEKTIKTQTKLLDVMSLSQS